MKRATRLLPTLAIVLCLPLVAQAQHAFLWTQAGGMQDLGTITGAQASIAYGISQLGEVVGYDVIGGSATPFRWTSKTGMQTIPAFGTIYASAIAVNNAGAIIGEYYPNGTSSPVRAFIWTPTGGLVDLGTLGGNTTSAYGINEPGQVVGTSTTASGEEHGFLWTHSAGMQDLGTFLAGAVNDTGMMAGVTITGNQNQLAAAVWDKGRILPLCLGGASAINDLGQVIGEKYTLHTDQHAFIWNAGDEGVQLLPMLPGTIANFAQGINNSGEVAGFSLTSSGYEAFIWTESGGIQNIGSLGGNDTQAFAINDSGEVVGSSNTE